MDTVLEDGEDKITLPKHQKNTLKGNGSFVKDEGLQDFSKSPIIEYLKQVHKDNLLPHFLPFKKLAEAQADFEDTGEITSGFKYSLDEFHINIRVAPSLARSI